MRERCGNGETKSSRLAATAPGSKCYGAAERLLGDSVNERQQSAGLVRRLRQSYKIPRWFGVLKGLLKIRELRSGPCATLPTIVF